jgi:soluble lytic murein transglycosylase
MQITENAAIDWARAEKIQTFAVSDLFDPKVNIEAGTWYLNRALTHWSAKDNPMPFALAEYNAGRSRVRRWVQDSGMGDTAGAGDLQAAMDFPMTKSYIAAIIARYDFYKRRGEFATSPTPGKALTR